MLKSELAIKRKYSKTLKIIQINLKFNSLLEIYAKVFRVFKCNSTNLNLKKDLNYKVLNFKLEMKIKIKKVCNLKKEN